MKNPNSVSGRKSYGFRGHQKKKTRVFCEATAKKKKMIRDVYVTKSNQSIINKTTTTTTTTPNRIRFTNGKKF